MVNPNGKLPNGTVGSTMPEPPTTPTVQTVTGTNHHHNAAEMDPIKRVQERENLRNIIKQWNANRLDLFEISEPNEVGHLFIFLYSPLVFFWFIFERSLPW